MNEKLKDLHLEAIENSYHKVYKNMNEEEKIDNDFAASKSAEITKDVAIKFGNFLGQKCFWVNNAYYNYQNKTYSIEQLFTEFLKQYDGTTIK